MQSITELINYWKNLTFKDNPFGEPIPDAYLYSLDTMKGITKYGKHLDRKPLAYYKQDGWVMTFLLNDVSKTSTAEATDFVSFSPIFHRLYEQEKLCPSNFIVELIKELTLALSNKYSPEEQYSLICGYITRGLRAFASFVREKDLEDKLNLIIPKYAASRNLNFEMLTTTWEEDMHNKTDVKFKLNNSVYRVWSYQADKVDKTAGRILRRAGNGYNILVPLLFAEKVDYCGWFLYNLTTLETDIINALKSTPLSYSEICQLIREDPTNGVLKKIQLFVN